jgi:Ion transport protein
MYCGNNDEHQEIDLSSDGIAYRTYINYGITNFDNLGTSLLSVFQIINSDTWYQQLINMMDVDIPFFGAFYCIMMIVVG